ncbi:MAG: GerMN domain-containing protein [Microthrixaceae bacterium]|nr:GerMN domain-containing protein [Microthrixaceae bacterium]
MRVNHVVPLTRSLVALGALVVVGACGIPLDNGPRPITTGADAGSTETTIASGGDTSTYVYFLMNDRFVDVTRDVSSRRTSTVVAALLNGPTASETADGIISQIPAATTVQKVTEAQDTIRIETSEELLDVIGTAALQAVGQIVLTVTEIKPSATVEFVAGGQPVKVSSPIRGDVSQVSECDFVGLLPTDDELNAANLSEDSVLHIAQRRRALQDRCPDSTEEPS